MAVAMIPRRMNISLNFARSDAMRISQSSASSMPNPTAAPLIALMIGQRESRIAVASGGVEETGGARPSLVRLPSRPPPDAMISTTSSPLQKLRPAPVKMMQRTLRSELAFRNSSVARPYASWLRRIVALWPIECDGGNLILLVVENAVIHVRAPVFPFQTVGVRHILSGIADMCVA